MFRNIRFTVKAMRGRRVDRLEMAYVSPEDLKRKATQKPDEARGERT